MSTQNIIPVDTIELHTACIVKPWQFFQRREIESKKTLLLKSSPEYLVFISLKVLQ